MRLIVTLLLIWTGLHGVWSQPLCTVVKYNESDGVSSSHVTQLLQDKQGFMWFSTWNGLCRYDGYEFQTFKPALGDGCHITTDRIRSITLLPDGQILCQADEGYYMFDLHNYHFRDLTTDEQAQASDLAWKYRQSRSLLDGKSYQWKDAQQTQWTLHSDGRLTYLSAGGWEQDYPLTMEFRTLTFAMADKWGNLWALDYDNIYKFCTDLKRTQRLAIEPRDEVKCLFADRQGRNWVATKGDQALRVYSNVDSLPGYLGSDGRVHQDYTRFGASVYCMYESKDGTLWLGTKPDGLYRLRPVASDVFKIDHFTDLPMTDVYHITGDRYGRLWVAMLGGGLCYTSQPDAENPCFLTKCCSACISVTVSAPAV